MTWTRWAADQLDAVGRRGQLRHLRPLDAHGPSGILDGRAVVSFASNDYLGLTAHPAVVSAACEALERWGAGAGSARLIVGNRPIHADLEAALADWKETEAALLFPTGFMANLGVLSALGGPDVTVVSDELNHASIIDGCRLSRSKVRVFRHRDAAHCAALLDAAGGRCIVVTDAVFSMDGDIAPVTELADICARRGALLVLDEAHVVFPLDASVGPGPVLRVGTLSKTLGSLGGFVAGPRVFIELLTNRARPFIFTTGSTPADTAAALAALHIVRGAEGEDLRVRLRGLIDVIRPGHPTPIVPIVIGDEQGTLAAAATLLDEGILVPAIRPPTVPIGSSRLRVTLSAAHRAVDVARLVAALAPIAPVCG